MKQVELGLVSGYETPATVPRRGRTELELSRSKSFEDRHRSATLGAKPRRVRFLGGGGFRFYLGWNYAQCCEAKRQ
jgi:hypothetical protein